MMTHLATRETSLSNFEDDISGYVARPGSASYESTVDIDNGRTRLDPSIVIYPRSSDDVAAAIRYCRQEGLPLTVKGGGHSAAGYCLNRGGAVLDLSLLTAMRLDADRQTLFVQMGNRWQDVYNSLLASGTGLIPIGGGCLTVGLPGFLLGGGYSFASRSYGMGCDNVLSIDFVTPDGELHHLHEQASSSLDRDLFWACRGGGGGNLGVAVAMELQLHRPRTPTMLAGQMVYPLTRAEEVIGAYNQWIKTVPDELAVYGFLGNQPDPNHPGQSMLSFRITPVYNGAFSEGVELLQPMLALAPASTELYDIPLPVFEDTFGTSTLVGDRQAYIRSGVMPAGALDRRVIGAFTEHMANAPSADSFVVWTHGGGKISQMPAGETSYPHRDARFIFELKCIWDGQADMRRNVEWAYHFGEALRPSFTGAYANYIDPLLVDWPQMYYGAHYPRLLDIKRAVDPDDFFGFQQGIGSSFRPSGAEPLDLSPLNRTTLGSGKDRP
jgi:hypothetical protein